MGVNDYGTPTDSLATPSLSEWAAAVADRLTADAWIAWTPTLTGFTASAMDAKYWKSAGGLVVVSAVFTVTAVSGGMSFTLPEQAVTASLPNVLLQDVGGSNYIGAGLTNAAGDACFLYAVDAAVAAARTLGVSATVPFTWAAGDKITVSLTYRSGAVVAATQPGRS